MAILSFCRRDSRESLYQVVKGVMRLATELRLKGYMKYGSDDRADHDDHDDDDDDESSDTEDSSSDSGSDPDSFNRRSQRRRKPKKSDKSGKSTHKREKLSKSKERKSRKGQGNEGSVRREVREPCEMIHDPKNIQKAAVTQKILELWRLDSETIRTSRFLHCRRQL